MEAINGWIRIVYHIFFVVLKSKLQIHQHLSSYL
jgi:hypothetical protein